jgi:glycosyl transferase, family 25
MEFIYILITITIILCIFNNFKKDKKQKIDINDILKNNYYINLEHRKDRNIHTINELKKIGITNPNRFNAIKKDNGAIGCYMSHNEVLKKAKNNNWNYVTIFEDDILFLKPKETLEKLDKIVNSDINWDVIILGGNNYQPYKKINDDCIKVNNCQTTTAYIVKKSYYDTLINHWHEGLQKLIETNDTKKYALDIYWKILQKKDNFLLIIPLNVVQKEDYSDIEKQYVNYVNLMLN